MWICNGPAAKAGIRPGDVITGVGDRKIDNVQELLTAVRERGYSTSLRGQFNLDQGAVAAPVFDPRGRVDRVVALLEPALATPGAVLDFWFGPPDDPGHAAPREASQAARVPRARRITSSGASECSSVNRGLEAAPRQSRLDTRFRVTLYCASRASGVDGLLNWDAHKTLNVPYDSGIVFCLLTIGSYLQSLRDPKSKALLRASATHVVDEDNPDESRLAVEITTASLDTGVPDRDAHLRSEDFFAVERFPTLTFVSTKIAGTGGDSTMRTAVSRSRMPASPGR